MPRSKAIAWTSQPQQLVPLNPRFKKGLILRHSLPIAGPGATIDFTLPNLAIPGFAQSYVANAGTLETATGAQVGAVTGRNGTSLFQLNNSSSNTLLNNLFTASGEASVLLVLRSNGVDATGNLSPFHLGNGGSNEHYPFSDGNIYAGPFAGNRWISGVTPPTDIFKPHAIVATHKSGAQAFYMAGKLLASDTRVETPAVSSTALYGTNGSIYEILIWNRVLSYDEGLALSQNPWQINAPLRKRKKRAVVAASGVSASSATTDGADVLASSVGPIVAASSAKTDGADVLAASVGPVVGVSSATTDGADVLAATGGISAVGATTAVTDGADVLSAAVAPIVAASSATTDGADVLAAAGSVIVAATSATTDGADVLAAQVANGLGVVSASSATTDGADVLAANLGVIVAAQSATTDGADVLASVVTPLQAISASSALVEGGDLWLGQIDTGLAAGGGSYGKPKRRYVQKIGDRLVIFTDPAMAMNAADAAAPKVVEKEVTVKEIKAVAKVASQEKKVTALLKAKDYEKAMKVYEDALAQQDEDEVEMLLMSL